MHANKRAQTWLKCYLRTIRWKIMFSTYMYKQDLALNYLQGLICHKNPTNQPTNLKITHDLWKCLKKERFWKFLKNVNTDFSGQLGIHQPHPNERDKDSLSPKAMPSLGLSFDIKLRLVVRLLYWSSGEYGVHHYWHYSPVLSDTKQ